MTQEQNVLLGAVQDLRASVRELTTVVEREYPKREEIEERFTTKESAKKRLFLFLGVLVISLLASYFVTVTTVSTCFLSRPPHIQACGLIPGFNASEDRGAALLERFTRNEKLLLKHDRQLDRIERRLSQ